MRYRDVRKFTLLDLMTLVAATAAGFGAMRRLSPNNDIFSAPYSPIPSPTWVNWVSISATNWAFYLSPLVAAWTVGILILRLRNPRPILHRLARQPGLVACCTATVAVGLGAIMTMIGVSCRYGVYYYFPLATYPVGIAVLAAWTLLAVSGRWRPERNWIDRAGRIMGFAWLALIPMVWGWFFFLS